MSRDPTKMAVETMQSTHTPFQPSKAHQTGPTQDCLINGALLEFYLVAVIENTEMAADFRSKSW